MYLSGNKQFQINLLFRLVEKYVNGGIGIQVLKEQIFLRGRGGNLLYFMSCIYLKSSKSTLSTSTWYIPNIYIWSPPTSWHTLDTIEYLLMGKLQFLLTPFKKYWLIAQHDWSIRDLTINYTPLYQVSLCYDDLKSKYRIHMFDWHQYLLLMILFFYIFTCY